MENHKEKILEVVQSLIEAREIIFTQIVNLVMSGELKHLENAFDIGDEYDFKLKHFESTEDANLKKLVRLCKNMEETIFAIMDLNGISENEVNI